MPLGRNDANKQLWAEGEEIELTFNRTSGTTATLSWNLPTNPVYYDGVVIVMAETELEAQNFPIDGERYTGSFDWTSPADSIHGAQVVAALYGDKLTTEVNITNLTTDQVYFAAIFAVTNTLQYFSEGKFSYPVFTKTENYSGHIEKGEYYPPSPETGQLFFDRALNKLQMWDGGAWVDTTSYTVPTGPTPPASPVIGEFFYSTALEDLLIWTGSEWKHADTYYDGVPTYQTMGIGSTGRSDEFMQTVNDVKRLLGWPVICVELSEEHIGLAIDNAIAELRRRTDVAYRRRLVMMTANADQQLYYLNDPTNKSDEIVEVMKIHRANQIGLLGGEQGLYAQGFLTMLYADGIYDLTSLHAVAEYSEIHNKIFAGEISFSWDEASRQLRLYKRMHQEEKVILDTLCEKTEQEILVDRYAAPWIEDWAKAECKYILGMIRSKYGQLPGAGGGISLNGTELIAEANTDFEELRRQVTDYEIGNGTTAGNWSITIG